ncbi:MAG: CPBP family intramembrane glutamic endopeptidase [Verrucomicrobiota bacterium]|nr:CPBP family intramembrane glutamic endopeptidase [Verrucomicrobiota bacterium]
MRHITALAIYLVAVFGGAALIAPITFGLLQEAGAQWPLFEKFAQTPFHRVVNRCLLLFALAGLFPLLRSLGIRNRVDLGLRREPELMKQLGGGLLLGFGLIATTAAISMATGARHWNFHHSSAEVFKHLKNALVAGAFVATIEEVLFRGGIFNAMRRGWHRMGALVVSSAIYALVHFFEKPQNPLFVQWDSGFYILAQMCRGFGDINALFPAFFTLSVLGMILALAYERSGSLYFSIGAHASLVFFLKTFTFFTSGHPGQFSDKIVDQWWAFGVMLAVCFYFLLRPRERQMMEVPYVADRPCSS